jgi:hypothetical protein
VDEFDAKGLKLAVITYDSVGVLKHFSDRVDIRYPLLSDEGSATIRAFGILNEGVQKDTPFYGVPHPGTYIVNPQGIVKSKYFEDDYRDRFTAAGILVREFGAEGIHGQEITTPHLKVRTSASNVEVYGGSHLVLALDIELPGKMHVYAPGVTGTYIPIAWTIDESPAWKAFEVSFPPSKTLHLEAIKEAVPVYENKFRLLREIRIGQLKQVQAVTQTTNGKLSLEGSFRYQACDDKVCYPPRTIPLRWDLKVLPYDRQRAPAELRGKNAVN